MHTQHTSDAYADPSRWGHFTAGELGIIRYALMATADFLEMDAVGGAFSHTALEGVAAEYLATVELYHQLDDHRGEEHPPIGEALEIADRIRGGAAPAARTQPGHAA